MESLYPYFKNIWFADDDEDDLDLFETAMKELIPSVELVQFSDSEELLSALQHSTPDILFLDINMPPMDGKKCLMIIKGTQKYRKMPVIMLTVSQNPLDVIASYGYGATLYIIKPSSYNKWLKTLKAAFYLPWDDPEHITARQYQNNQYIPFRA